MRKQINKQSPELKYITQETQAMIDAFRRTIIMEEYKKRRKQPLEVEQERPAYLDIRQQ